MDEESLGACQALATDELQETWSKAGEARVSCEHLGLPLLQGQIME